MADNPQLRDPESTSAGAGSALPRSWQKAATVMGFMLAAIALSFSAELHLKAGFALFTEQALHAILGLAVASVFIKVRFSARMRQDRVPWYDCIFAAAALFVGSFLAWRYPVLADDFYTLRNEAFALGIVLVPLTFEALRRTAGVSLTIILLSFILYALFGDIIPGKLQALTQPFVALFAYLAIDNVALVSLPLKIISTIVVAYIFFGQLLLRSGGSEWFTDIATALIGRQRGGAAKIAVVASGLFGSISGTAVANVASTGVITIPMMKQAGYEPKVAGAFEAVASTGGQIMPPIMGAAAFLMAEMLQVGYADVVLAALIPALLYYFAVFIYADLEAARKNIARVPEELIPPILRVLREGWFFMLPFALLIYALFWMNRSPEEAALWSGAAVIVVSWVFGYKGHRITPREIVGCVRSTGENAVDIVIIGGMAGIILGVMGTTGLGDSLTFVLVQFGEGNLPALLVLTAIICIVLGMSMPTTAIYLLVAAIAAPPLIKLGVNPMAAHMYVFYFGIVSLITPPVAVAAFVAANLAGARPMETAVTSVRIGWTALVVPVMFVMSPNLIMQGTVIDAGLAVVTAVAGVWFASAGLIGYLFRPMGPLLRIGFTTAGLALLIPAQAFDGAGWVELAGVLSALMLIGKELFDRRRRPKPA
ncbi:MAG: TRAP transporter fused permease subunit [Alphaproteobacteria bacterium]|nr:TRAP transporter fused permease subunit [Alphaproteobacteria bacterium]